MAITHIVRRPWTGVTSGQRVDVTGWRNADRLEKLGYIRLLTPEELAMPAMPDMPDAPTPAPAPPEPLPPKGQEPAKPTKAPPPPPKGQEPARPKPSPGPPKGQEPARTGPEPAESRDDVEECRRAEAPTAVPPATPRRLPE